MYVVVESPLLLGHNASSLSSVSNLYRIVRASLAFFSDKNVAIIVQYNSNGP